MFDPIYLLALLPVIAFFGLIIWGYQSASKQMSQVGNYQETHRSSVSPNKSKVELNYESRFDNNHWKPGKDVPSIIPVSNSGFNGIDKFISGAPTNETFVWELNNLLMNELPERDYNFAGRDGYLKDKLNSYLCSVMGLIGSDQIPTSEAIYDGEGCLIGYRQLSENERFQIAERANEYRQNTFYEYYYGLQNTILEQVISEKLAGMQNPDYIQGYYEGL